jgi:hypothetical protein
VSRTRRLAVVLVLNLGLVASLVVVGLAAHSLAVFAAGALVIAVIVGYHAAKLIRKIAPALASPPQGAARSGSPARRSANER